MEELEEELHKVLVVCVMGQARAKHCNAQSFRPAPCFLTSTHNHCSLYVFSLQMKAGKSSWMHGDPQMQAVRAMHSQILNNVGQVQDRTARILQGMYELALTRLSFLIIWLFVLHACSQSKSEICCAHSELDYLTCRQN